MELELALELATAVEPSAHVMQVANMFGLGVDQTRVLSIIPPIRLPIQPGQVVFITGASGSGKSSLLRLIREAIDSRDDAVVIDFNHLPALPDVPLVDCFGDLPLKAVLTCLSLAGLNDAFVMLRKPGELSDGQRYRLRLAQTLVMAQHGDGDRLRVVLADEFGATLDRLTASIIARNVRKWTRRQARPAICFVAATTHDDLLEAIEPDVLVEKGLGERIQVVTRAAVSSTGGEDDQ